MGEENICCSKKFNHGFGEKIPLNLSFLLQINHIHSPICTFFPKYNSSISSPFWAFSREESSIRKILNCLRPWSKDKFLMGVYHSSSSILKHSWIVPIKLSDGKEFSVGMLVHRRWKKYQVVLLLKCYLGPPSILVFLLWVRNINADSSVELKMFLNDSLTHSKYSSLLSDLRSFLWWLIRRRRESINLWDGYGSDLLAWYRMK